MPTNLTVNGNVYAYPNTGDQNWGDAATNWASAVTSGMLQKSGGTFTLTAEVDFGALFGLKALYFKGRNSNPASAGIIRLSNTDTIAWRNAANSADVTLSVNASNQLVSSGPFLNGGQYLAIDGTAGAPSYSWSNDPDTGIYRGGSGIISFSGNASDILTVGASTISCGIPINFTSTAVASSATINALNSSTSHIRITGSTATTINGISAGLRAGQIITISSISAALTLAHQSGSASGPDRIYCPESVDLILSSPSSVSLIYDLTAGSWVVSSAAEKRFPNGSSGFPSISFQSASTSGFYYVSGSDFSAICGGQNNLDFTSGGANIRILSASAASPSVRMASETNTGIFRGAANEFNISIAGTERFSVLATGARIEDTLFGGTTSKALNLSGEPGAGACSIGIYGPSHGVAPNTIAFNTASAQRGQITAAGNLQWAEQFHAKDGLSASPSYSFTSDPDTGFFRASSGVINVVSNGTDSFAFGTTANQTVVPIRYPDGAVGAPGIQFQNDTDTGFYRNGSGVIEIASNAATVAVFGSGAISIGASGGAQNHIVNGRSLTITHGAASSAYLQVLNTSTGSAIVDIAAQGAGDPFIYFNGAGVSQAWSMGVDNSDSDKFKISASAALGTTDYFQIDSAGSIAIGTGTTTTHRLNTVVGTTVGAAGGASALPATPTGYITININGTDRKIPYYAT